MNNRQIRVKEKRRQLVKRRSAVLAAQSSRVILRPHIPGDVARIKELIDRVSGLDEDEVGYLLEAVMEDFAGRHRNFRRVIDENFRRIEQHLPAELQVSPARKALLGSYFTQEYSVESAALFNPSIIPHPEQKGVPDGCIRFIMSFRATGEGHISSIEFRSGIIDEHSVVYFDPLSPYVATPEIHPDPSYELSQFRPKLEDLGIHSGLLSRLLDGLGETFTTEELKTQIEKLRSTNFRVVDKEHAIQTVLWLARSSYEVVFRPDVPIAERVLFPVTDNESAGIEDARFVPFVGEDGSVTYYATHTAYNGFVTLPQMLETRDFLTFEFHTLGGKVIRNKGMALFPRRIGGKYVMLSRQDGVNNYIMFSDNPYIWSEAELMQEPVHPQEFIQIGNCGSPVETEEGWLTLFHGVGPMRRYAIWAALLDLDDPRRIIGRLSEPVLTPDEHERDGYVPNVVYTCGFMKHGDSLIVPYGIADQRSRVATIAIPELIHRLKSP